MSSLEDRYKFQLAMIPPPGNGSGCHVRLLAVANLGVMIGLSDEQIFSDVRSYIPSGNRRVPDSEITKTIARARLEVTPVADRPTDWKPPPKVQRRVKTDFGKMQRDNYMLLGTGIGQADFFHASPIELPAPEKKAYCEHGEDYSRDLACLLRHLYREDEYVFIGDQYGGRECVQTVSEWLRQLDNLTFDWSNSPHIIPNPLTGDFGLTHQGKHSYRADNCVKDFRYAVVEFDALPICQQFEFWGGFPAPLVALIDSGGKSLHGWVRVSVDSQDDWNGYVRDVLYRQILEPMGVDPACKNPARLSRTPGRFRPKTDRWQQLLYLAPEGSALCLTM